MKQMQKYHRLSSIIPEAIALLILCTVQAPISNLALLLAYSLLLRFAWNSAVIVHGLGHTMAIACADRKLSVFNSTNILENRSVLTVLSSFLPFHTIFIPNSISSPAYLTVEKSAQIRLKAIGGIALNLIVAATFYSSHELFLAQTLIVANLLIVLCSVSDLNSFITGVADYLYCGNFGLIAERRIDDEHALLPTRMSNIALQMGRETEVRGGQAGGGLVIGRHGDRTIFVGKEIINRKRGNLTATLEARFASSRNKAISKGVKPVESSTVGVWHYRYTANSTPPSESETYWHEWIGEQERTVWQFVAGEWFNTVKNVHHCITHNGDFDSWQIFADRVDLPTLKLWLARVLDTPQKQGESSIIIAGMMDLLATQGMWYESVRLAYQQAIATSIDEAFDGKKPTVDSPNTAPQNLDLSAWAEIIEGVFIAELYKLKWSDSEQMTPAALKASTSLHQNLVETLKRHNFTESWSIEQTVAFVKCALEAFFNNDLYRATQIFLKQAKGSFGLVATSTLEDSALILSAKAQTMSIGFNRQEGYTIYASEPAAIDRILFNQPQSFRLDLKQSGEVAKVNAQSITLYSLTQQQELAAFQLEDRWISMVDDAYLSYVKPFIVRDRDPIAHDLNSIPQTLDLIKQDWSNPASLNRRSANYLVYLLTEKLRRLQETQQLMFRAGKFGKIREMSAVDFLITGEENSLWLGERFAKDLKIVFPFLNIVTMSANQILQHLDRDFGQLNLCKDSLVLAITQSGQTFATLQAVNAFDSLSSQGVIGELFVMTGELSSFMSSIQARGKSNTVSYSSLNNDEHNRFHRIFFNGSGRTVAEPSTLSVAAARQTLTELLFYLAKEMRNDFPDAAPLGLILTTESLMVLQMIKEDFLTKNVMQITGANLRGESIKSAIKQKLIQNGRDWANHLTEMPLAWVIQTLYILISIGWAIPFGHTLPLVKVLSGLLFGLIGLPTGLVQLLAPIVTFADLIIYIFGAWLWTLAIRYCQGRELFARTGKRTLIVGDVDWVNQLLEIYISKLFALSYGIANIEVHGVDPQNHLLHIFGHRIVRGTLIWLGVPNGKRSERQQKAENAVIMTGKRIKSLENLRVGAEIIAVGSNSAIASEGFSKTMVLNSSNDSIYFRSTPTEQREQIEKLRESCFGSFERLLAGYVFFRAFAEKVASIPFLKYKYWQSQSRTKVMTTASPIAGLNLEKLNRQNKSDRRIVYIRAK